MQDILFLSNRQLSRYSDLLLAGQSDVWFSTRSRGSSLSQTSVPSLGPTQPLFQEIPGPLSREIKWPVAYSWRSAQVKNEWSCTSTLHACQDGVCNCGARTATLKLCVLHHLVYKGFAATELDPLKVLTSSWNLLTSDCEEDEGAGTWVRQRPVQMECVYTGVRSWAVSNVTHGTTSSDVPSLSLQHISIPTSRTLQPALFVFVFVLCFILSLFMWQPSSVLLRYLGSRPTHPIGLIQSVSPPAGV